MVRRGTARSTLRALLSVALAYVILLQGLVAGVAATAHAVAQVLELDALAVICSSLNGEARQTSRATDPDGGPGPNDHRLDHANCCTWGSGHGAQFVAIPGTVAYGSISMAQTGGRRAWTRYDPNIERPHFNPAAPPRAPPRF